MSNIKHTTRIDEWRSCEPSLRYSQFAHLTSRDPSDPELQFLFGCAAMRCGSFGIAERAFTEALAYWPTSLACVILQRTSRKADAADLKSDTCPDSAIVPSFTSALAELSWEVADETSVRSIPESDKAQTLLIYAMSGTSHLGMYVKAPGELVTRIMGVIDIGCGIRTKVFPVCYCRLCGHRFPKEIESCIGCGSRWTREGDVLSHDQMLRLYGLTRDNRHPLLKLLSSFIKLLFGY